MPSKIIVSYDGTANEDDAVALGRAFAGRRRRRVTRLRAPQPRGRRRARADRPGGGSRALGRGARSSATRRGRHVVTDRSTPNGLRALAQAEGAEVIVFCSDSHTAKGHVAIGNSASACSRAAPRQWRSRPSTSQRTPQDRGSATSSRSATQTAERTTRPLRSPRALGASVEPVVNDETDLIVIDSRPEAEQGRVSISLVRFTPDRDLAVRGAGHSPRRERSRSRTQRQEPQPSLRIRSAPGPGPGPGARPCEHMPCEGARCRVQASGEQVRGGARPEPRLDETPERP